MKNIIQNIFKNKINLFLFIIFILIIAVGVLIQLDYYPVLIVNNNLILAKKLNLNTRAALNFYSNYKKLIEESQLNSASVLIKDINYNEVKAIILNDLIERIIIHDEVQKKLGSDLKKIVNDKLNLYLNSELENAGLTIYNLKNNDFKNEILIPQAERDILTGRLFLENKKIDDWLKEAKKNLKIIIFDPKFEWDGEKIILKK
jgi:hypothetical protein